MGTQIVTQFEEQLPTKVLAKQEEQQVFAQTKSTKYVIAVEVSSSTQFVITIATTPTSHDQGDNVRMQTIIKAQ